MLNKMMTVIGIWGVLYFCVSVYGDLYLASLFQFNKATILMIIQAQWFFYLFNLSIIWAGFKHWKPIVLILVCLSPLILLHGVVELAGIGHGAFYSDAIILGFLETILVLLTWGCVVLFYLKKRADSRANIAAVKF